MHLEHGYKTVEYIPGLPGGPGAPVELPVAPC